MTRVAQPRFRWLRFRWNLDKPGVFSLQRSGISLAQRLVCPVLLGPGDDCRPPGGWLSTPVGHPPKTKPAFRTGTPAFRSSAPEGANRGGGHSKGEGLGGQGHSTEGSCPGYPEYPECWHTRKLPGRHPPISVLPTRRGEKTGEKSSYFIHPLKRRGMKRSEGRHVEGGCRRF